MKKIILLFSIIVLILTNLTFAQNSVDLYFFYREGCPYCAKAKPFLEGLKSQYPSLRFYEYEISQDPVNQELYLEMVRAYNQEPEGVPAVFIGEKVIFGYDESMNGQFLQAIQDCIQKGCSSPAEKIKLTDKQPPAEPQSTNLNLQQLFWPIIVIIFLILIFSFLFRRKSVK